MFENIKLEKSLYNITGKTFTEALAELDPDSAYENTSLKGLDAFERQLKRFDIHVSGAASDKVEKFFISSESAVLFPEFVRRMIKRGIDENAVTGSVCAAVSYTDSVDHRALNITSTGTNPVAEGGALPVTTVKLASTASRLKKFARKLSCSYETIRKQRIDSFGVVLRELGASIAREINGECAAALSTGITATETAATSIAYSDLAGLWSSMTDHNMDIMLCPPALMAEIMALDEMKLVVSDFMESGRARTPYGVTIIKCSQVEDGTVIGLDSSCAAELVLGTDVIVDFDKLISTQCDEIACSITAGIYRLTENAVGVLEVKSA
ncbi:MAG: hypothetical protein IJ737_07925 [Ruminococcus sp.]|nr:hypothetical protein [Ruminococcus sp.]